MIIYECPECGNPSESRVCPSCHIKGTVSSHLFWCSNCNIPLYHEYCSICGNNGTEFTTDVRPVFPEERLLIEVILGCPFKFRDDSVWASSGDRYYVNGERINFSTSKASRLDTNKIRMLISEFSSRNTYDSFEKYINLFISANSDRYNCITDEAISYIQNAVTEYDIGNMFVSFSGGKDSSVVSDLVMRSLGRADILHIFGDTTLEFPETISYINRFKVEHSKTPLLRARNSKQDFYSLCKEFGPPSRMLRWCCTVFKTGYIGDRIKKTFANAKRILVFNGIRRNESVSRSKYDRDEINSKISKQVTASPIIDWFDFDIWLYILTRGIMFNNAYRLGYNRVGCWLCPNNNKWAQFLSWIYMPEESMQFKKILLDFAIKMGKEDPEGYVTNNGWKARSGGAGIELSKNVAIDFKPCVTDEKSFLYELNRSISPELYELFKPFGYLNFDMGEKRLGEVYVLDAIKNIPIMKIQGRLGTSTLRISVLSLPIAARSRMLEAELKFKCQITKYQMCVGCHACENVCKHNAIILNKRDDSSCSYSYKIDEKKCIHCYECIGHFTGGCYMRRVLLPRGKDYTGNERAVD